MGFETSSGTLEKSVDAAIAHAEIHWKKLMSNDSVTTLTNFDDTLFRAFRTYVQKKTILFLMSDTQGGVFYSLLLTFHLNLNVTQVLSRRGRRQNQTRDVRWNEQEQMETIGA